MPGVIVDPAEQGPELAALVSRESATIPSDAPRVAMRRSVPRLRSPRDRLCTPAEAGRPPVVLVVFDAFPSVSLLDAQGRIDRSRYPTFARLADGSTWFPYSTTTVDETGRAFRWLLTGQTQWRFAKPTYAEHPKNLFTALGRKYRIEEGEEATSLRPKRLCPNVTPQTAGVGGQGAPGAVHELARARQAVAAAARPATGAATPLDIAIAVNGTIEATATSFAVAQSSGQLFSALIPEASLRQGVNAVQLFAIQSGPILSPIEGT